MLPRAERPRILESLIADHPETADQTYRLALSPRLRRAFLCSAS